MDNLSGVIGVKPFAPASFDWYQGTWSGDVNYLRGVLSEVSPGVEWEHLPKAPHGYAFGWRMSDSDGRIVDVWSGGMHERPHFVSSGSSAQLVAEAIRAAGRGKHAVARVDPCMDFVGAGVYEGIQGVMCRVSQDQGVSLDCRGDHLVKQKGRTVYLGAKSSHVRARCYEKGEELRAKFAGMPDVLDTIPEHLTRFEAQIRPKTAEAKARAAELSPLELFGAAAWLRTVLGYVAALDVEPFQAGRAWRKSDDERSYRAMLMQYGPMLFRRKADHGSWAALGAQLGDDLAELLERASRGR